MKSINLMEMVCQIDCFSQHYQANMEGSLSLNSKLKVFLDIKQEFNELVKKENAGIDCSGSYYFIFCRYCNLVVDLYEGIEKDIIRNYFPTFANALKFINDWLDSLSDGKRQAILCEEEIEFSHEEQSSFVSISKQIIKNYSINSLLILLKKINENELRDLELTQLLSSIDLQASGIRVSPDDNLTAKLAGISQASFDRFKLIQTTIKSSTSCSEEKRGMLEGINTVFTSLLGQEDPKLPVILSDLKQLSSDYGEFLYIHLRKILDSVLCQVDCFSQHYQASIEYTSSFNSKLKNFLDIKQDFSNFVKKEDIAYSDSYRFLLARYYNLVVDLCEGIETDIVRNYFPILANALKFINDWLDSLSDGKRQAILCEEEIEFSHEEQSSFVRINKQILKNYNINSLLILLKKINESELRDLELTQLLSSIDLKASGIRVSPHDNLTDKLAGISQASFSHFKKIQATVKANPVCSEEKEKMFARISALFTSLEQADPESPAILSELEKLSLDYNKFLSNENTISQGITKALAIIQVCVRQTDWNRKAKYTFGPPQGIRAIRKLLNEKKLSDFEKLVFLHKLIAKKCLTNVSRRKSLTLAFYERLATNLQAIYSNLDPANKELWDGTALGRYSGKLLHFTWITEEQTEQLTGIFNKLANATSEITSKLQNPQAETYTKIKRILIAMDSRSAEIEQLERFRKKLQAFKQLLFSPEWNKKGIGFVDLYRKLPQGIKELQSLYSDKKLGFLAGEEKMTLAQLIYLIKAILQTYTILQQRVIYPSCLRDAEVHRFYESNYTYFRAICVKNVEPLGESQSQDLSLALSSLFDFIFACEGESTLSILANSGLSALNDPLALPTNNWQAALFASTAKSSLSTPDTASNTNVPSANFSKQPNAPDSL